MNDHTTLTLANGFIAGSIVSGCRATEGDTIRGGGEAYLSVKQLEKLCDITGSDIDKAIERAQPVDPETLEPVASSWLLRID